MKKWTAVEYDVSKVLIGTSPKHIEIPAGMKLQLEIQLEDDAYGRLSRNPTWLQKMQEKANSKVNPVLAELKKKVADMDGKAAKFDPKTADIFTKDINSFIKQKLDGAGVVVAKEVNQLFEEYKKGQSDLTKFKLKCGGKIVLHVVKITATVTVAGVSHGALAPVAIVGIAQDAVKISQECVKLAVSADQAAKLIQADFLILKKVMKDDLAKATKLGKIAQGVKEVGLNMLSGALGMETPTLKNCKAHIEVHRVGIAKLEAQSKRLSKGIYAAMDEEEKWRKKFEAAKASLPAEKVGKIVTKREKAEQALHKMLEATIKVNESIKPAEDRQELFDKTIKAMMTGIPAWVGYMEQATSLAITLGTHLGDASKLLEGALGVLQVAEGEIALVVKAAV